MVGHTSGPINSSLPPQVVVASVFVILIIYLWIVSYFVRDLYQPERRVYGGDKTLWLFIILFGSIIGIAAYIFFGREN